VIETFFATHHINLVQVLIAGIGYLMVIPLGMAALYLWRDYRTERFIEGIEWVLLEIQVPRDVIKTPAAMELFFSSALYHKSEKGFWEKYIQGAPWFWFSLEIVSIEGKVHFFIRVPSRTRNLVETQIYAQYPQAKVVETEDYAFKIPEYERDGNWNTWGCEFTKKFHDAKPIKTYKQLDEMKTGTKEEFKIDPITTIVEYLGSLPKGQQVWIQMVVRQSIKRFRSKETGKWVDIDVASIENIKEMLAPYTKVSQGTGIGGDVSMEVRAPTYIDPFVKSMMANVQQLHFDCGIRVITLADKRHVSEADFGTLRRSSRLLFRPFASSNLNYLDRINSTQFDAPWADPTGLALTKIKKRMLNFYRDRTFFHPPLQYSIKYPFLLDAFFPSHRPKIFVLSSEELASIFHFPGMVSETPSFKRIESKIAKPPANLPT